MAQQFQVEEVPDNVVQHPGNAAPAGTQAAIAGILLGLKALSQGAAIALGNIAGHIFALLTAGSVFWLFLTIPAPNTNQIVWGSIYAGFVICANVIVRRK